MQYEYKIFESSPKAKAFIESYKDAIGVKEQLRGPNKFPWAAMKIGQSFVVEFDKINKSVLKNLVAQKPKAIGKRFKVIEHEDFKIFEVARIA